MAASIPRARDAGRDVTSSPDSKLWWRRWVARFALGELLGIACAAGIFAWVGSRSNATTGELVAALVAAGAVEGAVLSMLTWDPLHQRFPGVSRRGWVAATVVTAVVAWLAGYASAALVAAAGPVAVPPSRSWLWAGGASMGACFGAALGAAQWLALRGAAQDAWRWVPANAIGWSVAMVIIFAGAGLPAEDTGKLWILLIGAATGLLSGVAAGAITGMSLLNMKPLKEVS